AGLPAVPAVLGVLALPVTGHAATSPGHELAVVAVAVHVAAAAAWVGGLGAVAWLASPRRELLATTLPRYSRLATACLVAIAATGPLNVALRLSSGGLSSEGLSSGGLSSTGLPSVTELLDTPYGWILLGKSVGVVTLGLLGARARARLLPAVAARRAVRLTGWLTVELAVMGVVIGLASVLAGTPPPAS
ncbi:MAG: CopD family protein, partial [Pseudonocardiaceae bacterium]